jgi:hypothetical protein
MPPIPGWKIHESIPVSLRLNTVKGEKYEYLTFLQFLRASCCLRSSNSKHSHQHSDIQRPLHTCLNVRLEILNWTVSSVPRNKSYLYFINVIFIGFFPSSILLLQYWHIENIILCLLWYVWSCTLVHQKDINT